MRPVLTAILGLVLATASLVDAPPASAQLEDVTNLNSVTFSIERGYITGPITVELSAPGEIVFSTAWGPEWKAADFAAVAEPYTGPIAIDTTTQIRAMMVGDEHVVSHTYIDISARPLAEQDTIRSYPFMVTSDLVAGNRGSDITTIVEFGHPNRRGTSAPAGIRNRQGGIGQTGDFRLYFRSEYGDGRLDYDLFADVEIGSQTSGTHDKVNFHGGSQDAFGSAGQACGSSQGTFMKDRFYQHLQTELNGNGVHGQYYLMWHHGRLVGVKNAEDVPHQGWHEATFGPSGDKSEFVLRTWFSDDGDQSLWNASQGSDFGVFAAAVDVTNYLDYHLVQWFAGNTDWPRNNMVLGGHQDGPFYNWAFDMHYTNPGCNRLGVYFGSPPSYDADYTMAVEDRIYLHTSPDGVFTLDSLNARWDALQNQLQPAVALGEVFGNVAFWQANAANTRNRFSAGLVVLEPLKSSISPVAYSLRPGAVPSGASVDLSGGSEIWFTNDGTDPRASGGEVSSTALRYDAEVPLADGTVQMLARVRDGDEWGPARPMVFQVGGSPSIQITEATASFIEITNTGTTSVDLEYWRLQGDVRHKFGYNRSPILHPGESVVLAEDTAAFTARWGVAPDGQFLDAVNGTDTLRLVDTDLNVIHETPSPFGADGVPGAIGARVPVAGDPVGLILNEWNAVKSSKLTNDPDPLLGRVAGNGGDWFEVVTVDDTDLRGWDLVVTDADSYATLTLSDNAAWADVPAGTIITFSQEPVVAEDGTTYGTNVSLDPEAGDWWMHVVTNEVNDLVNQTAFAASADDWTLEIRDAEDTTRWGPVGEGIGALPFGVGDAEVGELEAHPSPSMDPEIAPYDDGDSSSFGAPNSFGGAAQIFEFLRTDANPGDNANCDNTLTIVDALVIAQYGVGNRTDTASCPLADPATEINASAGDLNLDGDTTIVDALLIAQCTVGIDNEWCAVGQ